MMRKSVIAAAASVAIVIGSPARAQDTIAPPPTFISAEFGAQSLLKDLSKAQEGMFTQYRAKPGVVTLRNLSARWTPGPTSLRAFELNGTNIGYSDMSVGARASQAGLWDAQLRWDRTPHTYSGEWKSLLTESSKGVWSLPATRPTLAGFNAALAKPDAIRNQWDAAKLQARFTPTEALDSKVEYTMIKKSGQKSMGVAFGSPGGNSLEVLEPVDWTQHEFKLSQEYVAKTWQVNAAYNLSAFSNSVTSVYADNPLLAASTTGATQTARLGVSPDNMVHGLNLAGAWKLPYKTKVTGAYTWSVWNQDAAMLPAYNNSMITGANATNAALNPTHLGGKAGTKVLALEVGSRPFDTFMDGMLKGVGLGAKFRRYEFRDEIGAHVDSIWAFGTPDAGNGSWHQPSRSPFRKEEREVSARYAGRYPFSVGVDYQYEMLQSNPEHANAYKMLETGPRLTFDFTGIDWMQFRARYSTLQRRSEAFSFEGVFYGIYAPVGQLADFRMPLYADRDRTRFHTSLSVYPTDQLSFTGTFQNGKDTYGDNGTMAKYGYQKFNNNMYGLDVDYTPIARLALNAGYSIEKFDDQLKARYRSTAPSYNNTSFDWFGANDDEVTTYYLGANGTIMPNKVEGGIRFEHSFATFLVKGWNPVTPTATLGGSASDAASAVAANMPEVSQKLEPMNLWVSYRINSVWSTTLRFQTEKYDQNDWRSAFTGPTTVYRPTLANPTSATGTAANHVFLGSYYPSYNAQLITITMTYRPGLMRFGRSAL